MKREVFVREKMSRKGRLEGKKYISVYRDMHMHEYLKVQRWHPVQMLNLKAKYITLTLLSLRNRLQPQFFFLLKHAAKEM